MKSILLTILLFVSCGQFKVTTPQNIRRVEIQGHRGARGLYPENSLIGFQNAQELGVDVLELDVVFSKDKQIVVSHEPIMSPEICLYPDGTLIPEKHKVNLYQLNYKEIKKYDCGSKIHPRFLQQKKVSVIKPLLAEVLKTVLKKNPKTRFNIETKTTIEGDGIFHPVPKEFIKRLYTLLKNKKIISQITIQSFDPRTLNELHQLNPNVQTVLLVENLYSIDYNLNQLTFKPTIYSPNYLLLDQDKINHLKQKQIKVIPWTVNEVKDMKKMIELGVDGIITDYPDRALNLFRN
jgi:glycerophosphoryl diester phosphodiesterase